jgi:hypothetical protein
VSGSSRARSVMSTRTSWPGAITVASGPTASTRATAPMPNTCGVGSGYGRAPERIAPV